MELFHLDIETCGSYKNFESFELNDEKGAKLFKIKYEKMDWKEKFLTIDIAYSENAPIISTFGKICCISFGYIDNTGEKMISSYSGEDEKDIVEKFNNMLKKVETKNFKLCGFRILYFDIPWILHKLHKYGIEPASIIYQYDKKPWDMRIVDLSDDWKGRFAWGSSFDDVCYELEVKSPKDKMSGSDVHKYYWDDRIDEIRTYCEKDVRSSIEVSQKMYK